MPRPSPAAVGHLLLTALLLGPAPLLAQDTLRIAVGRSCPACRVTMTPVVALGADAGVHGPELESRVARDSRGRYFVGPTYTPGTVAVYGPDGRFQRAFGRQGQGPGEFPAVRTVAVGPGDSIWVVSSGGRVSVVSPQLEVVREMNVGSSVESLVPGADGRAVGRVGQAHMVTLGPGDSVGGPIPLPEQDGVGSPFDNSIAPLGGDRFVAPQGARYRLDVVRRDGTHERVVLRETGWFPQLATDEEFRRQEQLGGEVGAIAHTAAAPDGRVWALVYRVDMAQMPAVEEEMRRTGASMPPVSLLLSMVDAVVELFDLAAGTVVATGGAKERFYTSFMDGEHIVGIRELDDGNVVLDVWRLGVRDGGKARKPVP